MPVVELEPRGPATHTVATDTRDLFYPSARTMSDKKGAELVQKAIRTMSRDRVVKLDTWSPGKSVCHYICVCGGGGGGGEYW